MDQFKEPEKRIGKTPEEDRGRTPDTTKNTLPVPPKDGSGTKPQPKQRGK
jgi:hypothetical protein